MESLAKYIEFLSKTGFIRGVVEKNTISQIKFLPLGTAFLENIRNEWHKNKQELNSYSAIGLDDATPADGDKFSFIRSQSLRENLLHVKGNFQNELPLIIKSENVQLRSVNVDESMVQIDIPREALLATNYFFTPSVALEKFYHIQRERKICWMKYSSNPSRYFLSDLTAEERDVHKLQSLKIKATFGVGAMEVENIHFVPLAAMNLENEGDFVMKDPRLGKNVMPVCIRTEFKLETAACALLLDAIENNQEKTLALNRKLAPYQCGIFCYFEDKTTTADLSDLSTHLSNVIRKVGISALNLQKCHTSSWKVLTSELSQMDRLGVPYCIILDSDTLRSGLMKLRSRDTALSETIHISDVSKYLQKIFNS